MMEQCGEMEAAEARLRKERIYRLMVLWGLEPDDALGLANGDAELWNSR